MYHEVDADGGGSVSLQEFEDWFRATQRTQVRESCHGHLKHSMGVCLLSWYQGVCLLSRQVGLSLAPCAALRSCN